ncbi:MAG: hypothetical protein HY231_13840 [Acidobacteria bacterium]|nr:hypothetical protein [Acidobacteriota bacterium]
MDANEACEALQINKGQLDYLVKHGKIVVQGEGDNLDYAEADITYLAEQSVFHPGKKLSKLPPRQIAFSSDRVNQARRDLIDALKDACLNGGLTRDEAQGKLSLVACDIFEAVEPITWQLPS